ncbi:DUF3597 domain-containing protein [Aquamicrobium soli]|uniref:DUF3597 domain-containing protein n=1 Tax=Aquamicrobium soli TaxID=1811518 RepID=A0ABV7KHP1_9HYPH
MGIFDKIKGAIFGRAEAAPAQAPAGSAAPGSQPSAPAAPAPTASASPAPAQAVDVAAILNAAVAAKKQKLNWKTSIVDLMKALDMESSLAERKELAAELGYTGSTSDSAAMNMWLHKALLKKLAENGGKVPADLLD